MAWWKGDDRSHANPKLLAVDLEGTGLYWRAVSWCSQHETDGHLPAVAVPTLAPGWSTKRLAALVARMVAEHLWIPEEGGYVIRDFLDFNPSRASLEEKRERERKRRAGQARNGRRPRNRAGSVPARCEQGAGSVFDPVPSRPVKPPDDFVVTPLTVVPARSDDDDALAVIAQRRLESRQADLGPVPMPARWLATTTAGLRHEHAERLAQAPVFDTVEQLADWLEPPPDQRRRRCSANEDAIARSVPPVRATGTTDARSWSL